MEQSWIIRSSTSCFGDSWITKVSVHDIVFNSILQLSSPIIMDIHNGISKGIIHHILTASERRGKRNTKSSSSQKQKGPHLEKGSVGGVPIRICLQFLLMCFGRKLVQNDAPH